jgi:hypothetical protein
VGSETTLRERRPPRSRPVRAAARVRGLVTVVALGLGVGLGWPSVGSAEQGLKASMDCRPEAGTGRLLCTVVLAPPSGRVLSWSDALVVAAPPAARPLRSRVGSSSGRPEQIVIGFVLGGGEGGRIEVEARAVTCPEGPRPGACGPERQRVSYELKLPGG